MAHDGLIQLRSSTANFRSDGAWMGGHCFFFFVLYAVASCLRPMDGAVSGTTMKTRYAKTEAVDPRCCDFAQRKPRLVSLPSLYGMLGTSDRRCLGNRPFSMGTPIRGQRHSAPAVFISPARHLLIFDNRRRSINRQDLTKCGIPFEIFDSLPSGGGAHQFCHINDPQP